MLGPNVHAFRRKIANRKQSKTDILLTEYLDKLYSLRTVNPGRKDIVSSSYFVISYNLSVNSDRYALGAMLVNHAPASAIRPQDHTVVHPTRSSGSSVACYRCGINPIQRFTIFQCRPP